MVSIHLTHRRIIAELCIISAAVVRQISTDGDSHRPKQLRHKDELPCDSDRTPVLRLLKRRDGTHHDDDDVGVFSRCFPGVHLSI